MMPSLFKYFTIVGGGLLAMLIAISAVTERGGPGPSLVNAAAPKAAAIRHDPQASRVERLRAEEAALRANAKIESPAMAESAHLLPPSTTQVDTPQAAEPIGALTAATEGEAANALQLEKERLRGEGARKRLARERAKALEESASRRQDQMYYGNAALYAAQRRGRRDLAPDGPEHKGR